MKELLEIPRTRQGYTEVSGTVWTDDKLIAGQINISLLLTPFVSDEAKEKMRKRIEESKKNYRKPTDLVEERKKTDYSCVLETGSPCPDPASSGRGANSGAAAPERR